MPTETLRPNAPGDECAITLQKSIVCPNHYQEVDEVAQDGYGTYVKEVEDAYHRDLYNMEDTGVGIGIINFVKQTMWVWHEGGRDRIVFKFCVKTNGVAHEFIGNPTGGVPVEFTHTWNVNPETTNPWTWAEIDALQVGVALRDPLAAGGNNSRCTQIYIEVDYVPTYERTAAFDTYFAIFEATTWYGRISITDLDNVVHSLDPGVLGDGDALSLSLDHLKSDDFFFSFEDYAGDKRDWLVRGCMVNVYIDRFKPPTTLRFHGMVEEVNEEWPMPATVVVKATGRDKFSIYLDRKVTETYLDKEVSVIVKDLLTIYAPDLDQTNIDVTTTTLEDARFPYRSLKEILDYLGVVSGYTYRCEPNLDFYWKLVASEDTGIVYSNRDISASPDKLSSLRPIRNRVYVLGGDYMEIDQEQLTVAATKNTKDFWFAQSFTPERSDLNQVSLHLKRTGDPANLEGEIRTDDPGNGPDEKVATFTIDKDFVSDAAASWRPVRVKASLLIGVKYWIVLQKVGDGANNYEWSDDNDNAGENAFDADGVGAWTVQAASYQMAFKTHYSVPVLAVKQDYGSSDDFMWREIVHEDKAIVSRVVARQTAQALLDELKDETPSIQFLRTINQTSIPDRGKLVTVTLAPLKISSVQYEVKRVFFKFRGGEDGTDHMDVFLGRSSEELDEWLNRLRLDIDRARIGSFGIEEGLVPMVLSIGPDSVTANDAINLTVIASGNFRIDTAKIDFSDIG